MSKALQVGAVHVFYPVLSVLLVLGVWWGIVGVGLVPEAILPGPTLVGRAFWDEAASGRLPAHVGASGARLVVGFFLGASIGVLLGLVMGVFKDAESAMLPIVEVLRPIPPLAWIPLALIWLGIGEESKVFLIALTVSFPVMVATLKGVQQVDVSLLRAARSLDVSDRQMLFQVVLPAAAPDVVTGLRLGWTLGITILVGAEMIAATTGLGFFVMNGMNNGRFDHVILGIFVLGALGVASDFVFARLSKGKVLRWHAGLDKAVA